MVLRFVCLFCWLKLTFGRTAFQKFLKSSDDNKQNFGKMLDKYFPIRQFVGKLYYYQSTATICAAQSFIKYVQKHAQRHGLLTMFC